MKKTIIFALTVSLMAMMRLNASTIDLGQYLNSSSSWSADLTGLNLQINSYNQVNTPSLPTGSFTGGSGSARALNTAVLLDVTGWTYVCLNWGNIEESYYVSGDTGNVAFYEPNNYVNNSGSQDCCSAPATFVYNYYIAGHNTSVPDQASTLTLLGLALSGIGLMSRRPKA
jgi:hypothetical protein